MMLRGTAYKWIRNTLMLVVAAVVLVSVTAYALSYAREVSHQRTCVRNLKLMGEACRMYQEDWHGVLVPYGAPFHASYLDHIWPWLLEPYLERLDGPAQPGRPRTNVHRCPAFPPEQRCFCPERDYGMNEKCGGWLLGGKPIVVPMNSVKHPDATIMIAEVGWPAQGGSYLAAKPSEFNVHEPYGCMFPTRHMGKGNVLWIDGHVSSMTQKQYNMRDKGPYNGNIWLRLEGPKPPVP